MESGKDTSCRFSFRKGPKFEHTIDFTLRVYAQPPNERLECIWWIFRKQSLNLNASCKRKKGFKDSYSVLPFAGTGNSNKLSKETQAANPTIFEQIAQAMVQMIWHLTTVLVICWNARIVIRALPWEAEQPTGHSFIVHQERRWQNPPGPALQLTRNFKLADPCCVSTEGYYSNQVASVVKMVRAATVPGPYHGQYHGWLQNLLEQDAERDRIETVQAICNSGLIQIVFSEG